MKNNKGFSLFTVLIAVSFVGILGLLVLYMALSNFNMKVTDLKGKDSFYTAERAIEEIRAGLQEDVGAAMSKAYTQVLETYNKNTKLEDTSLDKQRQSDFEDLFIKELLDSLAMSGIANEIAGSSAPTSGSEHLISHALDKILEVPQLHGIQVGIATYIMSKVQDHRYVRVETVLRETGFFDYAATLGMKREDFIKAIEMAPSIKPFRHTYLHEESYRELAKKIVLEDEVLQKVLV